MPCGPNRKFATGLVHNAGGKPSICIDTSRVRKRGNVGTARPPRASLTLASLNNRHQRPEKNQFVGTGAIGIAPIIPIDPSMTGQEVVNTGCDATEPPNCRPRRQRVRLNEPVGFAAGDPISIGLCDLERQRPCVLPLNLPGGWLRLRKTLVYSLAPRCSCSADCLSLAAAPSSGGTSVACRSRRGRSTRRKPRSRTVQKSAVHTAGQIRRSVRAGASGRL